MLLSDQHAAGLVCHAESTLFAFSSLGRHENAIKRACILICLCAPSGCRAVFGNSTMNHQEMSSESSGAYVHVRILSSIGIAAALKLCHRLMMALSCACVERIKCPTTILEFDGHLRPPSCTGHSPTPNALFTLCTYPMFLTAVNALWLAHLHFLVLIFAGKTMSLTGDCLHGAGTLL